jgi:uncharacterized protein (TIGR02452 family)
MNREFRQQLAQGTLDAIEHGYYKTATGQVDFATAQHAAQASSKLYRPTEAADLLREFDPAKATSTSAEVRVYAATTLAAATRLAEEYDKVGVLNFASARHPGGGFLGGSQAQEESLARSSGLYPCLTQFAEMYAYNGRPTSTGLYSDYLIYSPGVPVLRHDDGEWLAQSLQLDIITAPAVNAGALARNSPELLPRPRAPAPAAGAGHRRPPPSGGAGARGLGLRRLRQRPGAGGAALRRGAG